MSKLKLISLVVALVVALGAVAPRAVQGSRTSHESAASARTAGAGTTTAEANKADTPEPPKRKGNGFVRALTAPFRALGRLFGGGRKNSDEAKKRQPQAPAADSALAAENAATQPPDAPGGQSVEQQQARAATAVENESQRSDAARPFGGVGPARAGAPAVAARTAPQPLIGAVRPAEGARIVRPAEGGGVAPERPRMWIPVIAGVPPDSLSQGRALLEHGYVQEAIAELTVAATTHPNLVESNNLLGLAYDRMGWHTLAAEAYRRALTVAPKDAAVLANLGYSLYLSNDYHGSLKRLKQATKLNPGLSVVHNQMGIVQARLRKYDDAFRSFARASNEYDAHVRLAGILDLERRDRDAIKHYEAALRIQPGTSAVLERLVALYERTGDRTKADMARRSLGQPTNPQRTTTGGGG